jgi:hypothetical protein
MFFVLRFIPAAAAACLLASCGGGDAGAPSGLMPAVPAATPTGGVAVDGYLQGATALCDSNGNGSTDAGEVSVVTDAGGGFVFTAGCSAGVVVTGGTSVDTGLPFKGVLKAPAGATVASPLTTLLAAGMTQAQLNATLGLPAGTDLLNTDPAARVNGSLSNAALMAKTAAVQQLIQKTVEMLAGLGGTAAASLQPAIYTEVAAAFADQLKTGGTLIAAGSIDQAMVSGLVKVATLRVAVASAAGAEVRAAVGAVNAEALAQVTAGALKAQGEALLAAAPANLTNVTKAAQTDGAITSFVTANLAQLAGAPTAATTSLASTLTGQVAAVLAAPPADYLALAADSLTLANGTAVKTYSMAQFQSDAGIQLAWPLPAPMLLKVAVAEIGNTNIADGQKLSAAVAISETTATGKAEVLGYIDNVDVRKTAGGLQISVPTGSEAVVYGVSTDGKKKAVIDFAGSVAGIANTLSLAAGNSNSIVLGNVVNYAINKVSNDFTGIYSLRGKYKVSVVINGLPLRKADGSALPALTITVPTRLDSAGGVVASRSVSGSGLIGTITLTD